MWTLWVFGDNVENRLDHGRFLLFYLLGGIAWWAHIGGFVFGALLCSVVKVKQFYRRRCEDDEMPW